MSNKGHSGEAWVSLRVRVLCAPSGACQSVQRPEPTPELHKCLRVRDRQAARWPTHPPHLTPWLISQLPLQLPVIRGRPGRCGLTFPGNGLNTS